MLFNKNLFRLIVVISFLFILVNFANAENISFNFYKQEYSPFETVQTDIMINNFTLTRPLDSSNIILLDKNNQSLNFVKNLVKISEAEYFFYFDLPNLDPGDYSFILNNVNYLDQGSFKVGRFSTTIKVGQFKNETLSVRPAFVLTKVKGREEAPFTLFLSNNGNVTLNVYLSKNGDFFNLDQNKVVLLPSFTKNINVLTSLFNRTDQEFNGSIILNYSSYNYIIPFFIIREDYVTNFNTNITNNTEENLTIDYHGLSLTTLSDKILNNLSIDITAGEYYPSGQIVINNNAGVKLNQLKISFAGEIKNMFDISPEKIDFIQNNNSAVLLLGINQTYSFKSGYYIGSLKIESLEGVNYTLPISVSASGFDKNIITKNQTINNITQNFSQVNVTIQKNKSHGSFIIIILLVLLLIVVLVGYLFYRKTKKNKDEFENFIDSVKQRRDY